MVTDDTGMLATPISTQELTDIENWLLSKGNGNDNMTNTLLPSTCDPMQLNSAVNVPDVLIALSIVESGIIFPTAIRTHPQWHHSAL